MDAAALVQPHAPQVPDLAAVGPGHKAWIRRSFTAATGRSFQVSIGVVRGARPGPVLAHVAGQHGMEHTGPVVLRTAFTSIDPSLLSGTLLLCPAANPLALELDFEVYPEHAEASLIRPGMTYDTLGYKKREDLGQYNMNRLWPDDIASADESSEGVARRVTGWLWRTMIAPAQVVIDHHAVGATLKPYIFAEEPVLDWTPLLGVEAVWCTGPLAPEPTPYPYRRLALQSIRHGKVGICLEYSTQHQVRPEDVAIGLWGMTNLMRATGMLAGQVEIRKPVWLIEGRYYDHTRDLTTAHAGQPHYHVDEYQPLRNGDRIATVYDLQSNEPVEEIRSPYDGLMMDRSPKPVLAAGDRVCRVCDKVRLLAQPGQPYRVPPLPSLSGS